MRFNAFNFAGMKKSTIWVLGIVMGLSFLSLLYLQVSYIEEMVKMRKGQFDESVQRSLVQACRNIELVETKKYLEDDAIATEKAAQLSREQSEEKKGEGSGDVVAHTHEYSITSDGLNGYSTFELKMRFSANRPSNIPKAIISTGKNIPQTSRALQEIIKDRYVYQRALLDEVVYNILYTASDKPLNKRINFKQLDLFLKTELLNNGIDIPYHFTVTDRDGTEVYHCPDYTKEGSENTYPQVLFKNDPPARMATVNIHFPTLNSYIFSSVKFMIPSLIFTFVLLVTFIFTIYIIFRQKKLTEIKNDFINNMTHEFKTPISTISLAAQMLKDPAVGKSPAMFQHISGVINDETKRLRFQVEKVLQMSMFEKQKATLKMKEVNANDLIAGVVNTFTLKVEKYNGKITSNLDAVNPDIFVDEMHFTNVIFNLLDNAVKYKKQEGELLLNVRTWNESGDDEPRRSGRKHMLADLLGAAADRTPGKVGRTGRERGRRSAARLTEDHKGLAEEHEKHSQQHAQHRAERAQAALAAAYFPRQSTCDRVRAAILLRVRSRRQVAPQLRVLRPAGRASVHVRLERRKAVGAAADVPLQRQQIRCHAAGDRVHVDPSIRSMILFLARKYVTFAHDSEIGRAHV